MNYDVFLAVDAEKDILNIYKYIVQNDSLQKADYVYTKIKAVILGLATNPERGHQPRELGLIAASEYLQIHFKPYRIIYQITGKSVIVHCVLDGRRDLEDLLYKRLTE